MITEITRSLIGWISMVMVMGYFIWREFRISEIEPEEEEPPSTRLAVPVPCRTV